MGLCSVGCIGLGVSASSWCTWAHEGMVHGQRCTRVCTSRRGGQGLGKGSAWGDAAGVCRGWGVCAGVCIWVCILVCMGVCAREFGCAWVCFWVCRGVHLGVCRCALLGACMRVHACAWPCMHIHACTLVCTHLTPCLSPSGASPVQGPPPFCPPPSPWGDAGGDLPQDEASWGGPSPPALCLGLCRGCGVPTPPHPHPTALGGPTDGEWGSCPPPHPPGPALTSAFGVGGGRGSPTRPHKARIGPLARGGAQEGPRGAQRGPGGVSAPPPLAPVLPGAASSVLQGS